MRILLTGATGFIGVHLARSLCAQHDVAALLRPLAKVERLEKINPLQQLVWDEDATSLPALLERFRPEVVIHLASYYANGYKTREIDTLIESNIHFPTILLSATIASGCNQFINTGSYWQHYGNAAYSPVDLYAATKQAYADILTYYAETNGSLKAVTLELADTYGPEDPRPKVIALLNRAAISGETLLMSPGEQWLDLVHAQDVAKAYVIAIDLLQKMTDDRQLIYAVRSGQPLKLKDFVALFNEVSPKPVQVRWGGRPYRLRETMQPWTQGDVLPGWNPEITLRDGLSELLTHSGQKLRQQKAPRKQAI